MALYKSVGVFALLSLAFSLSLSAQFTPAPATQAPADPAAPPQVQVDPNAPPPEGGEGSVGTLDPVNPADAQHGVARLSFLSGSVNVVRAAAAGAAPVAAALNAPVAAQDNVQTGDRSSAELQVNGADVLRLGQDSDLGFADLQAGRFQAQLGSGTLIYSVLRSGVAQSEIDTPNIAFHPLGQGSYRLTILSDGSTEITIRSGEAEMMGPAGTQRLLAGHSYVVRGNANDPEFQEVAPQARDGFDDWSDARNASQLNSQSAQYVGPDVPGTADLDSSGTWVPSPYGQAWTPAGVAGDWAPYSSGQWSYDGYYGWVWVDAAPWGWAPYHYGRWFRNGGYGWCWWPGPRVGFHTWSPALVGFIGFGGGYRGLGWVPLAPYERVHPWWGGHSYYGGGRGFGYPGGLGSFRNSGYRGAVTFAAYNHFAGPGQRFEHLGREQLAGAAVLAGRLPVTPNRGAYAFADRPAYSNLRLNTVAGRPFATSQQFHRTFQNSPAAGNGFSAAPSRGSWSHLGASSYPGGGAGGYRSYPAPSSSPAANPARATPPRFSAPAQANGWQHFGDPGANTRRSYTSEGRAVGPEGGWHSFGRPNPATGGGPIYQPQRSYSVAPNNGRSYSNAPAYSAPRYNAPSYTAPRYEAPRVQQPRFEAPRFTPSAPAPHYSAPAPAPHYSAPAPHYSAPAAPHHSGGGGGGGGGHNGGGGGGGNHGHR